MILSVETGRILAMNDSQGSPSQQSGAAADQPTQQPTPGSQAGTQQVQGGPPAAHASAQPAADTKKAKRASKRASSGKGLPTFLIISIALLVAFTIGAIALLFLGNAEGKFLRVSWTFVIFAVFVALTAFDMNFDAKQEWYSPAALVVNVYILAVSVLVIWVPEYREVFLAWDIFTKIVGVVVLMRLLLLGCQLILGAKVERPTIVETVAIITTVLGILSGVLFSAPAAITAFAVNIPDLYWKIAVSTLILTALALSVFVLLHWQYRHDIRAMNPNTRLFSLRNRPYTNGPRTQQMPQVAPGQPMPQQAQRPMTQPVPQTPQHPAAQQQTQQRPEQPQPRRAAAEPDANGQQPKLLPWPTFEDGTPIPAGPDGQPDFSVPGAPFPPHLLDQENKR
jgi:hypothetical protein